MEPADLATLARHDRDAARQAIDRLGPEELAHVVARLAPRDLWQVVFIATSPASVVRALSPLGFFALFHEIGAADSAELLPLAAPAQIEACIDLECWSRGELVTSRVDEWLGRLLEAGPRILFRTLSHLDFESLVALFAGRIRLIKRDEDVDPIEMDDLSLTTLDELYYFAFDEADPAVERQLVSVLKVLRDREPEFAMRLMEGIRQELPAGVTEDARRQRDARLADLGLPDFDSALEAVARLDPATFDPSRHAKLEPEPISESPGAPAALVPTLQDEASLLAKALATLAPASRDRIFQELVYLTNQVLVATVADFADFRDVHAQAAEGARELVIGLEHLARGQVAVAAELLTSVRLRAILRIGRTLVRDLAARASRLRQAPVLEPFGRKPALLGFVVVQTLDALSAHIPAYPLALDRDGETGIRPFAHLDEVHRVDAVLGRGEAIAYFEVERLAPGPGFWKSVSLRGCTVERVDELSAHQILATAMANAILGEGVVFAPIPVARLAELRATVRGGRGAAASGEPARIDPAALASFTEWLGARLDELHIGITGAIQRLADESTAELAQQLSGFAPGVEIEPLALPILVVHAPAALRAAEHEIDLA